MICVILHIYGLRRTAETLLDFLEEVSSPHLIINLILVLQPIFRGIIIILISGTRPMNGTDFPAFFAE